MSSRTAHTPARRRTAPGQLARDSASRPPGGRTIAWLPAALLALAVVATFWPVCAHEFTNWDDGLNVSHNPLMFGHTLAGLLEFWKFSYSAEYIPLSYTVWWLLAKVARVDTPDALGVALNPYVFHTANLLLHVIACLIAYRLLRLLTARAWPACAGAMLFALHPLQVEPVAWVTGLKDVLSGALGLLALLQYVRFARADASTLSNRDAQDDPATATSQTPRRWHYLAATAALIGAVLAKPSAVTVPLMAAALDLWILRRPLRRVAVALLPWVVIVAAFTLIAIHLHAGAVRRAPSPLWMRPLVAGDTLAFYIGKFLLPVGLSPVYPHAIGRVLASRTVWVAWLAPAAIALVAWAARRRASWGLAALAIFVAGPLPVLGLVPFDYQRISTVADRYVYLGLLGPAVALAFALSADYVRRSAVERSTTAAACAVVLAILAGLSFLQAGYWHDSATLANRALVVDPTCDVAYSNLAADALVAGRTEDALRFAQQAVRYGPDHAQNQVTLGIILQQLGRHNEAGVAFLHAAEADPENVVGMTGLAEELGRARQLPKAMAICRASLESWPDSAYPHRCMAVLLSWQPGHEAEALREAQTAVQLDGSDGLAHLTFGQLLDRAGRHAEAAEQFALAAAHASHPPESPH